MLAGIDKNRDAPWVFALKFFVQTRFHDVEVLLRRVLTYALSELCRNALVVLCHVENVYIIVDKGGTFSAYLGVHASALFFGRFSEEYHEYGCFVTEA